MSEPRASLRRTLDDFDVLRRVLDHVQDETVWLTELGDSLRSIRKELANENNTGLADALRLQHEQQLRVVEMNQRRQAWCAEIGSHLGLPPDRVALSAVASVLGGAAGTTLLDARDRLQVLLREVIWLNRTNAFLVRANLEAYQRFLVELTGAASATGRYGRNGARPRPAYGSLLRAKG
jgi:hypothetical protein